MKLRPLGNRVIVKPAPRTEVTKSGIIIPSVAENKEVEQQGEVTDVGPGLLSENGVIRPMNVKVGDHILFKRNYESFSEVNVDDEKRFVIAETDILAIFE